MTPGAHQLSKGWVSAAYDREASLVNSVITAVLGTLSLVAIGEDLLTAAAIAANTAGVQGVVTRQSVYSKVAVENDCANCRAQGRDLTRDEPAQVLQVGGREPVYEIAGMTFFASFLLQFFGGVDLMTALTSAGGLTGVMAVSTNPVVYSPDQRARAISTARNPPA